jgi:cleavage and polyadenylation specificity factor subunit 2
MTSFVKCTPLQGANSTSQTVSFLLEIDESRILLDCGSSYDGSMEYLQELGSSIDAVLISHADMDHLGGYVYAYSKLGLTCPCFVTTPVHDMGYHLMRDVVKSKVEQTEWKTITLDQIDNAFGSMTLLRYSQPTLLSGKCAGIRISAHQAGHTIGGTVWKIKKDTEDIVYAIDIHHRKERHLNGTVLLNTESLYRPTLLITDAWTANTKEFVARRVRDQQLIDLLMTKLSQNANVLIPVETSTRVLELAHLLDHHWQEQRLTYHLLYVSHEAMPTIHSAKNMLEWMGDGVAQSFATRDQAFDFRFLKSFSSLKELDDMFGPKVVLTTFPSLECGYGHELMLMWGSNPNNCILFPQVPPLNTLGYELYDFWNTQSGDSVRLVNANYEKQMKLSRRVFLEGEELDEFLAQQDHPVEPVSATVVNPVAMELDDSDSEEEDGETLVSYDTFVKDQSNRKGFFKQSTVKMYPVHETPFKVDEYGEVIDYSFFSKFQQKALDEYMDVDVKLAQLHKVEEELGPFKYIESEQVLVVKCQIGFVDFQGRSDGLSMRNIIQQVAPRKLVLYVNGRCLFMAQKNPQIHYLNSVLNHLPSLTMFLHRMRMNVYKYQWPRIFTKWY